MVGGLRWDGMLAEVLVHKWDMLHRGADDSGNKSNLTSNGDMNTEL